MIVSGYSLELYCERADNAQKFVGGGPLDEFAHDFKEFPHSYSGETAGECRKQARKKGWRLDWRNRKAICPKCAAKGIKP